MRVIIATVAGVLLALMALAGVAVVAGAAGFVAGAAAGISPQPGERTVSGVGPDKIALVRVTGPLVREGDGVPIFGTVASARRISAQLDRALKDSAVRAVVVVLNTPGGSVVASDEVRRGVLALRQAEKPVVALMTEVAASGGYFVAAAADHIVADPSTITGSIGAIVVLTNLEEFYRKLGIRTVVFKSGAFKDMGNPDRPVTPAEAAMLRGLVDEIHRRFVDVVAEGRQMDRARVARLADGRIYTGQQALGLGLVDSLGHLPEAIAAAQERAGLETAQVVEYPGGGWVDVFFGFAGERLAPWLQALLGAPPAAVPISLLYLMAP